MGDKWEGGLKNLKKWMMSYMDGPFPFFKNKWSLLDLHDDKPQNVSEFLFLLLVFYF